MATSIKNPHTFFNFQEKGDPRSLRSKIDKLSTCFLAIASVSSIFAASSIAALLLYNFVKFCEQGFLPNILSDAWLPSKGKYGFLPFIAGTLWITVVAMTISLPLGFLTAIFMAEYIPRKLYSPVKSLIELLAGIPSVVYGMWGLMILIPLVRDHLAPLIGGSLGEALPIFRVNVNAGFSVLAAGIVLSIMVLPIMISISEEVMRAVPMEYREAALALGATRWQTVKTVTLRQASSGIFAGIILSFCRAFGETMAVLMVAGNVATTPSSLFDPAYPLTALIANHLLEMLSTPSYAYALLTAGFTLFTITFSFNVVARLTIRQLRRARR
ncbi:MAG: phosphate ABC transporter permease subunit PstC [Thermoprotei archaeon]|nr:MAG: phosphate ABC transporter permease subunit PstC [Thermoprotei archaeon]